MRAGPLPFTLDPLPGEALETWLHTYAARLGVPTLRLIQDLSLPDPHGELQRGRWRRPDPTDHTIAALGAATGLTTEAVRGMFDAESHVPQHTAFTAWAPRLASRFCPACLADGHWSPNWRLRLQFFCHNHDVLLADRCPGCGQPPSAPPIRPDLWPGNTSLLAGLSVTGTSCGCGHDLAATDPPSCSDPDIAATAQGFVDDLLTGIRGSDRTPAARQDALDALSDLSLIAAHIAADLAGKTGKQQVVVTAPMLRADTLTPAATILDHHDATADPLIDLVAARAPSRLVHKAVPHTWASGSPTLRTRIAYGRSRSMTAIDQLRHAITLPAPKLLPHRAADRVDPAIERAARLPDQIWVNWAVRLGQGTTRQATTFGPAALVALLLPHSDLQLKPQIIALVNPAIDAATVAHHMVRLLNLPTGTTALRILTELAFAIDDHDTPIDYTRRRRLATGAELIDDETWNSIAHPRLGRGQLTVNARRYLYELLTGGSLYIAPPPHRLTRRGAIRDQYRTFVALMTTDVRDALHAHARRLLDSARITGEPLAWEPPTSWATTRNWPGTDPDQTDPAAIHDAILERRLPVQAVAADLGFSIEHVRAVLRRHPLPRPPHPIPAQHTILPSTPSAISVTTTGADKKTFHVDPDWLREEYLTWWRGLPDIADEIGCSLFTLRAFAHTHDIPIRTRTDSHSNIDRDATGGRHPSQFPQPLRDALRGTSTRQRLERFVTLAHQPSINQAAQALGCNPANLHAQLATLEHVVGVPLIHRYPGARPVGPLTPLGQDLCHQAQEHLGISPILPTT
ncbi:regulatory helix-turn-helix protein, lysR family [Promicromonospora umidemergens]|uniref:HTH lysR-type domain-containing protein n=1 Tax=Promicromonospora umidemergens TaxID=629679 RepID=A0ABP8XGT9_9MICO|nr:TniQ family protein [Promicromonospora umidemergens]MCP2284939.1 regulatory helix-turn-helix protein, lysR family [Promicromonospora umidemergens]